MHEIIGLQFDYCYVNSGVLELTTKNSATHWTLMNARLPGGSRHPSFSRPFIEPLDSRLEIEASHAVW